jgi:hypothetical protein
MTGRFTNDRENALFYKGRRRVEIQQNARFMPHTPENLIDIS